MLGELEINIGMVNNSPMFFIRSQELSFVGLRGLKLFQFVFRPFGRETVKTPEKSGGSGGARTRNLCRDRAAL